MLRGRPNRNLQCRFGDLGPVGLLYVICTGKLKLHRVFSSCCVMPASSRAGQFHWLKVRDSRTLVKPFIQVPI